MKLYLVTPTVKLRNYDKVLSLLVAANTPEEAKLIHPCTCKDLESWAEWDEDFVTPVFWESGIWVTSPEQTEVQEFGICTLPLTEPQIVMYSFHHG